jgi:phosphoribosylaminoimidazole carboxylase (NCAIR synthetase)
LYGKKEARENRKVGHVTLCAATLSDLQKDLNDWRNNS